MTNGKSMEHVTESKYLRAATDKKFKRVMCTGQFLTESVVVLTFVF